MPKWIKNSERLVYDGWRKVLRRNFTLPNGITCDFDVIDVGDVVAILAITNDREVVCFRQFRPGPEKLFYELPGGGVEPGEDPADAIARELAEETGYRAEIECIGSCYHDAYMTGRWHLFVGRHAQPTAVRQLDETECGDVVLMPLDEFKEALFAGQMTDMTVGYAGLHRLGLL